MDALALIAAIIGIVLFGFGRINLGWAAWLGAWSLQLMHLTSLTVHGSTVHGS